MSRLDDLIALRKQLDAEIERERITAARQKALRRTAIATISRGNWTTRVFSAVCEHFDVSGDDILGPSRVSYVRDARHVAFHLMHEAGRSYSEIGREMERDHTTVMSGCRRVKNTPNLLAVAAEIYHLLTGDEVAA